MLCSSLYNSMKRVPLGNVILNLEAIVFPSLNITSELNGILAEELTLNVCYVTQRGASHAPHKHYFRPEGLFGGD